MSTSGMSKFVKLLLPFALLAVGILGAVLIIGSRPEVETVEAPVPRTLVRVQEMAPQTVSLDVRAQGTVEPRTASALVAEVGGRILDVAPSFVNGGFFNRGQVLVRIDPRDYRTAVASVRAQVSQAEVRLAQEQAEAQVAIAEWHDLGRGAEPPPLVAREPQLAEARAGLDAAKAALQKAELDLERTELRAPYAGLVREKLADVGQFVAPGTPLAQVFAVDYAEITLPVPGDQLGFLDLPRAGSADRGDNGPAVELSTSLAGERRTWDARIVRTEGEIDPSSRMLGLIARLDDPYARRDADAQPLQVGQFVDARITGRVVEDVFVLPRVALRGSDAGGTASGRASSRVLILDDRDVEDARLRFREVEVLRFQGDQVILTAGLAEGDKVCISPLETPLEGMRVRVAEDAPPSPPTSPDESSLEEPAVDQPTLEESAR